MSDFKKAQLVLIAKISVVLLIVSILILPLINKDINEVSDTNHKNVTKNI